MASALGKAAMVGARGITATGASRRVGLASAGRGLKTNPYVEVRKAKTHPFSCVHVFTLSALLPNGDFRFCVLKGHESAPALHCSIISREPMCWGWMVVRESVFHLYA